MCNSVVIQGFGQSLYATFRAPFLWLTLLPDSPLTFQILCNPPFSSLIPHPVSLLVSCWVFVCSMVKRQRASHRWKTQKIWKITQFLYLFTNIDTTEVQPALGHLVQYFQTIIFLHLPSLSELSTKELVQYQLLFISYKYNESNSFQFISINFPYHRDHVNSNLKPTSG